jgi:hypothetical protein
MSTVVRPVASTRRYKAKKYNKRNSFPSLPCGLFTDAKPPIVLARTLVLVPNWRRLKTLVRHRYGQPRRTPFRACRIANRPYGDIETQAHSSDSMMMLSHWPPFFSFWNLLTGSPRTRTSSTSER